MPVTMTMTFLFAQVTILSVIMLATMVRAYFENGRWIFPGMTNGGYTLGSPYFFGNTLDGGWTNDISWPMYNQGGRNMMGNAMNRGNLLTLPSFTGNIFDPRNILGNQNIFGRYTSVPGMITGIPSSPRQNVGMTGDTGMIGGTMYNPNIMAGMTENIMEMHKTISDEAKKSGCICKGPGTCTCGFGNTGKSGSVAGTTYIPVVTEDYSNVAPKNPHTMANTRCSCGFDCPCSKPQRKPGNASPTMKKFGQIGYPYTNYQGGYDTLDSSGYYYPTGTVEWFGNQVSPGVGASIPCGDTRCSSNANSGYNLDGSLYNIWEGEDPYDVQSKNNILGTLQREINSVGDLVERPLYGFGGWEPTDDESGGLDIFEMPRTGQVKGSTGSYALGNDLDIYGLSEIKKKDGWRDSYGFKDVPYIYDSTPYYGKVYDLVGRGGIYDMKEGYGSFELGNAENIFGAGSGRDAYDTESGRDIYKVGIGNDIYEIIAGGKSSYRTGNCRKSGRGFYGGCRRDKYKRSEDYTDDTKYSSGNIYKSFAK